ncbi:hypothetical protein [Mucilaginibacter flavus]|uniref:hypothetical protein n=1 Tax=Mucilaginibacter flavus TaxID=931504 RepID=UPI0025B50DF7|nr:hypothetical protein [Mucilaginibacter flavus]MDN3580603.1 hypothetical protein [Mucilaginibacter flavus]
MQKTLLSLFFIVLFNNVQAQEIIEQFLGIDQFPNKFIIANKIVRRETYEYHLSRKGIADSIYLDATNFNYNTEGQLTDQVHFNRQNYLDQKIVYTYYAFGLINKKAAYFYSKNNFYRKGIYTIHEYSYDTIGRLENHVNYPSDTLFVNREKREYDSMGRLYRITKTTGNQPSYISNLARYNDANDLEVIDYFYKQDTPEYSFTMQTDTTKNGDKIININKLKPGEDEAYWCTYKFNRYNQCIEIIGFETVGLQKTKYTNKLIYNSDGTLYTSIFYVDKKMDRMFKYYYHR